MDIGLLVIRIEAPEDAPQVDAVVGAAFGRPQEAGLVAALRRSPHHLADLWLVATVGGRVVGQVALSRAELQGPGTSRAVALLGPLAVDPAHGGRGIGSALVRSAVARADEAGEAMVVLEGDPAFYGRLGFEPAADLGVNLPLPDWAPIAAGQAVRLGAWQPSLTGTVVYPPAFAAVEELAPPDRRSPTTTKG